MIPEVQTRMTAVDMRSQKCLYRQSPACEESVTWLARNFAFRKTVCFMLNCFPWNSNTCLTENTLGSQPSAYCVSNDIF